MLQACTSGQAIEDRNCESIDGRRRAHMVHDRFEVMQGISLLELMISMTVLTVGLLSMSLVIYKCSMLERATREQVAAMARTKEIFEAIRATNDLELVYADHSTETTQDGMPVVAPGARFDVEGLTATDDDAVGQIAFPEDVLRTGLGRTANELDAEGELIDADGDGQVEVDRVPTGSDLLPVRVVLAWEGVSGPTSIEVLSLVTRR